MAKTTPLLLGIGGDSGTGKSTFVGGIYKIFGPEKITNINLDDYHTFDRAQRKIYGLTALHPAANNMALMGKHAWQLKNGEKIIKPVYDHSTGCFAEPEEVEPKQIVIIGGLFPFFTQELRNVFDLKVYLDPDEELKRAWKIHRDAGRRGYSIEQVMKEIEARQDDIRRHIEPQKEYADIIIRFYPPNGSWNPQDNAHLNVRLFLSRTLPKTGLDELLQEAMGRKTRRAVRLVDEDYYGQPFHTLEIDGSIHPQTAAGLEQRIWAHLLAPMKLIQDLAPDKLGSFAAGEASGHSDALALVQLISIYYLLQAREARQKTPQEGLAGIAEG
ncbi:MAG: phosphoribulokinase [candidate division NC10 bacterium]|nr:phosphoribulokinase [candidate division NC10 bacterium]